MATVMAVVIHSVVVSESNQKKGHRSRLLLRLVDRFIHLILKCPSRNGHTVLDMVDGLPVVN
jgi:hypothetical protein